MTHTSAASASTLSIAAFVGGSARISASNIAVSSLIAVSSDDAPDFAVSSLIAEKDSAGAAAGPARHQRHYRPTAGSTAGLLPRSTANPPPIHRRSAAGPSPGDRRSAAGPSPVRRWSIAGPPLVHRWSAAGPLPV
ncbi:hypothetical protein JCM9533A_07170 [Catenuloplanes niger JCM 9533]